MDDDRTLVEAARSGDDSAWARIYDRYADKLHDHCFRILRDRDEAADALHDAFIAASRNLHQLREPDRLRPWLYSICRHCSLRRLKARDRVELTDSPEDVMAPDADLGRAVAAEELGELVWAAAEGLNPRDQALLDLSVRQGLEGQDLADAMGTSLDNSYVMLSRMRDQVERSLGALLIARLGRDDCDELDGLLADWDGRFSPLLRKRVARHVDGCEVCSRKRSTVASPMALLALVPVVPAPGLLKGRVISSIRNLEVHDGPPIRFGKDGFPVLEGGDHRRPGLAWLATAAAVLLLLGGLFLAGTGGDGPSELTTANGPIGDRARVTTTTEATTTTSTTLSPEDAATSTTLEGEADEDATPTTRPGSPATTVPGATPPTTAPSGPTTTAGVEITNATFAPTVIVPTRCSGAKTITVTADVTGSPTLVRMRVYGDHITSQLITMSSIGGGKYQGTVGNFPAEQLTGDATFTIEVQAFNGQKNATPGRKQGYATLRGCAAPTTTSSTPNSIPTQGPT